MGLLRGISRALKYLHPDHVIRADIQVDILKCTSRSPTGPVTVKTVPNAGKYRVNLHTYREIDASAHFEDLCLTNYPGI